MQISDQDSSTNPIDERYPLVFNLVKKPLPSLLPYSYHCPHIYTEELQFKLLQIGQLTVTISTK